MDPKSIWSRARGHVHLDPYRAYQQYKQLSHSHEQSKKKQQQEAQRRKQEQALKQQQQELEREKARLEEERKKLAEKGRLAYANAMEQPPNVGGPVGGPPVPPNKFTPQRPPPGPPPPPNQVVTLFLKEDHIIPAENAQVYKAYGIISVPKGEQVTLVEGDPKLGLPPPNQQYVRVRRTKDSSIGLVAVSALARA